MAHSIAQAYTKDKSDELYSPKILVDVILPYLDKYLDTHTYGNSIKYILCPFDTKDSEFVIGINERYNGKIIAEYSHLTMGDHIKDFFNYTQEEVKKYSAIISNPPFKLKLKVFKRLHELNKPWAMVANGMCLNYFEICEWFADHPCQLLLPDKRISFNGNPSSFNSIYFCDSILPEDLIFCHVPNANSGKDFVPSRMLT